MEQSQNAKKRIRNLFLYCVKLFIQKIELNFVFLLGNQVFISLLSFHIFVFILPVSTPHPLYLFILLLDEIIVLIRSVFSSTIYFFNSLGRVLHNPLPPIEDKKGQLLGEWRGCKRVKALRGEVRKKTW